MTALLAEESSSETPWRIEMKKNLPITLLGTLAGDESRRCRPPHPLFLARRQVAGEALAFYHEDVPLQRSVSMCDFSADSGDSSCPSLGRQPRESAGACAI